MSAHETAARAHNWTIGTIAAVALVAIVAHTQRQDEADDKAVRAYVEQQAKGERQ